MTTTDGNITELIRRNPEQGFRKLMEKFRSPIYWHVRRLVVAHADAQDATQETFIRAFRSIGQLRGEASLSAWLYRIATNEALRLIERRRPDASADDSIEAFADDYVDYSDLEAVKLQKAILSLPTKQRLAFSLRYYDELSYEEIARISGSNAAAAKANYHTAKQRIIEYMTSND